MEESWRIQMGVYNLNHGANQPFYNVLAGDGSCRYASQGLHACIYLLLLLACMVPFSWFLLVCCHSLGSCWYAAILLVLAGMLPFSWFLLVCYHSLGSCWYAAILLVLAGMLPFSWFLLVCCHSLGSCWYAAILLVLAGMLPFSWFLLVCCHSLGSCWYAAILLVLAGMLPFSWFLLVCCHSLGSCWYAAILLVLAGMLPFSWFLLVCCHSLGSCWYATILLAIGILPEYHFCCRNTRSVARRCRKSRVRGRTRLSSISAMTSFTDQPATQQGTPRALMLWPRVCIHSFHAWRLSCSFVVHLLVHFSLSLQIASSSHLFEFVSYVMNHSQGSAGFVSLLALERCTTLGDPFAPTSHETVKVCH